LLLTFFRMSAAAVLLAVKWRFLLACEVYVKSNYKNLSQRK